MSSPVISLICCPIRERYESFGLGGRYRGPLIPQPVKRRHGKNKKNDVSEKELKELEKLEKQDEKSKLE